MAVGVSCSLNVQGAFPVVVPKKKRNIFTVLSLEVSGAGVYADSA